MADGLRQRTAPPRDDSHRSISIKRVFASATDPSRAAIVRVESGTGVVFTPLDGGPETVWPFLRRRTVEQLVVGPDGTLHAATLQGVFRLTGPSAPELRKVAGGALCLAIDAAGNIAAGTGRGTVWLGDGNADFNGYSAHEARVEAIARRGPTIVSGGADAKVVWVNLTTEQATTLTGHVAGITAIALLSDDLAISASSDGSIKAWGGPERGLLWASRLTGGGPVRALAQCGDQLLATGRDRAIWSLSLTDGTVQGLWLGHHRAVAALHPLPDGSFWSRATDRTLRHWTTPFQTEVPPFFGHSDGVRACLLEDGCLTTASRDGTVRSWDLDTGTPIRRPFPVSSGAVQVLTRHTSDTLFFGGTDGAVGIVDRRGRVLHRQVLHEGPVTSLLRPSPELLVSGGADGVLRTWDAQRLTPLAARTDHTDRVRCLALVDDTDVTGSYDGTLARVPPLGGAVIARFEGHTRPVVGVARVGQHLVSGSLDGTVRSWTFDGQSVAQAQGDPDGVVGVVALSKARAVSVGKGGRATIWSVPHLEELGVLDLGIPLDAVTVGQAADGSEAIVIGDQRGGIIVLEPIQSPA